MYNNVLRYQKYAFNKPLKKSLKPIPAIYSVKTSSSPAISAPKKSPKKRIIQEDQYQQLLASDTAACLESLNERDYLPGYFFSKHDYCVVYYKILLSE